MIPRVLATKAIIVAWSLYATTAFVPRKTNHALTSCSCAQQTSTALPAALPSLTKSFASYLTAATITFGTVGSAWAVSGGGLDYANLDITGQDFSGSNYKGKDFTQVIAKGTKFSKSNLQGCRFYKAYLVNADFEGADTRGASFEDTSMDNANLRNINAVGAYFGQSLLDVASMEGGDFSDSSVPIKTLKLVCEREDVKGTNPTTGVSTRESLMCLD